MLSPRWRKVLRDLLANKTRTAIVVLSIAVGVFAIGMIGGTNTILSDDMTNAYLASNPASAVLFSEPFGDDLVQAVRHMPEVSAAEGLRSIGLPVRLGPDKKRNFSLVALPDFEHQRIGKITPVSGAWPPAEREMLLERASLDYLGLKVGDTAVLELGDGKTRQLRVAGVVHDVSKAAPLFAGQGYGYISMSTLEWLGFPRDFSELDILVAGDKMDKQHIQQVGADVRHKIEKSGRVVHSVFVPDPGRHPADSMMRAVTYILGALGLIALLLSGFLVANTISALLTQQRRQIGVMKAIGASDGQITTMYLATVLAFGLLALVIGVPLGALGGYLMGNFMAGMVNFDAVSYMPTPHVLALEVGVGLAVPFLAALVPVLGGTRVTVREAISASGSGRPALGRGLFDRTLESVRGLSRPLLLSLRNTFRRKGRLMLTLVTLTLGGATFIAVFSVRESTVATLDDALSYFQYDLQVNFQQPYRRELVEGEALRVPGVVAAESVRITTVRRQRPDGTEGGNTTLGAIRADTSMIEPTLIEGRWLLPEDDNAVVLNTAVTEKEADLKVGSTLVLKSGLRETTWRVVGIARSVMTGPIVYANLPSFERAMGDAGRTNTLWLVTDRHDAASRAQIVKALNEQLKGAGVKVGTVSSMADDRNQMQSQFDLLVIFLLVMAVIMALVGGLGLMGTMSLNVLDRTREIGVMRAIGASDGAVRRIFLAEGLLIGLLSWLAGAALAMPIGLLLTSAIGESLINAPFTYVYSLIGALLWLVLVVALAAMASTLPARGASRLSIREVLAYE